MADAPDAAKGHLVGAERLREYWVHGEGAGKIGWNTPNDWVRCVVHLKKYVANAEGLCAEYHHEATGMWPGDRANRAQSGHH
jgi:hypothetical protein